MKAYLSSADGVFPLSPKVTTIGRDGCDLMIKSLSVEPQHAFIEYNEQENQYVLQDLNTSQGTYVNDCRVQNAAVRLAPGDTIRFGYAGQPYQLQVDPAPAPYSGYTPVSQRAQWSQSPQITVIEAPSRPPIEAPSRPTMEVPGSLPSIGQPQPSVASWIPIQGQTNTMPKPYPPSSLRSRPLSAGSIGRRPGPQASPTNSARSVTGAWVAPPLSKPRTIESQEQNDIMLQEKESRIIQLTHELSRLTNAEHELSRKNQEIEDLRLRVNHLESLPPSARSDEPQLTYRVSALEEEVANKMSENAILKAQITKLSAEHHAPESVRRELSDRLQECQTVRVELERTKKDKDITSGLVTQMQRDMSSKDNTISRLTREIENQKRELREKDVQIAAITAKFTRVKESNKTAEELDAKDKELADLRAKFNASEAKLKEALDTIQSQKDEYRKSEELIQSNEEDVRKLRKDLEEAKKEVGDVQRGERVVRVDLETTSKRFERLRNRVLQVTFSTPGIKSPDGEITDDELVETLKKVVDERTTLHRKLMDMKEEVKIAGSSKKEIIDKLAKLRGFLNNSRARFGDKGRLCSLLKSEISMLESLTLDDALTFVKEHMVGMLKDELSWQQQTEASLEKCGISVKLSSESPAKHIENLSEKWNSTQASLRAAEARLNTLAADHQKELEARISSLSQDGSLAVKDAVEKTKLEYEEKMNKAIDEIRAIELEKRESALDNERKMIIELEDNLEKLRAAMAEKESEDSESQAKSAAAHIRVKDLETITEQLRTELDELRTTKANHMETSTAERERMITEFQKEMLGYKEQISQHSVTICAMEERLNKIMKKNKELNNEISSLRQENQELKKQPPPKPRKPEPAPKPQIVIQKPTAELEAMDKSIQILRQENLDLKRKITDQNNVVVGLRRDLAGASARLSDMTGELSDAQKEELEKNQTELRKHQYELLELRQQLTKVSHTADQLGEEIKAREAEIGKQKSALIKYKNLCNDKENRILQLEKTLVDSAAEQKKQLAVMGEEGRITSELTALGAQCRGERHEQVIGRQREALAELRTRIKELETSRPHIPNHDQALAQVVLLKKELAEIRAQQALAENSLDNASTLDKEVSRARGLVHTPNFDMEMEKTAHRETMEALDESEKSYLHLVKSCASCLEIEQVTGLRSMAHIPGEERDRLAHEREQMCETLTGRIKLLHERLTRKEDLLHGYEMDLAKLRQAEELATLRQDQVDGLATDVRSKTEESEYLRELLKRTKSRLDQEKRLNASIKSKKTFHLEQEYVEDRPPPKAHHCPVEDPHARNSARRAQKEKMKRKNYEIATLKKQLVDREGELCKTTARLVSKDDKMTSLKNIPAL